MGKEFPAATPCPSPALLTPLGIARVSCISASHSSHFPGIGPHSVFPSQLSMTPKKGRKTAKKATSVTPFPGQYQVSFLPAEPGPAPSCLPLCSCSQPWSNGDRKPESSERITGIFTQVLFSSLSFWNPSSLLCSGLPEWLFGDENLPPVHLGSSAFWQTHAHMCH